MKIKCPNCRNTFNADSQQEQLVNMAIKKKQRLLFIECPECYKDVPINPNDLLPKEYQKDEDLKNHTAENIQCPICGGIVSYVDNGDEKFWGCGECGNIWFSRNVLDEEIALANSAEKTN
jgi:ribosomal protein S27AE